MRRKAGKRASWAAGVTLFLALAFTAGSAEAAAPTATTGPTTAVGTSTATVTGTVDPGGQSTTWYVQYGTSTSYGSQTSSTSAGSGSVVAAVSADLTGLKAGTTYHYRIVATNSAGTSRGGDAIFTTIVPPGVTTGAASGITASSATLHGTVDPNGRATTYYFEYGTSTSYGTTTPSKSAGSATSAQSESVTVTGLETGRTYHFRIVATSDAGTSTGSDRAFTTSSTPAVTTEGVTSVAPTAATLQGTVTPNGLSTRWWFEYGTSAGYGSRTSARGIGSGTAARSVSLRVNRLRPATTYHYRLVAQNSSGKAVGADHTFSTAGPPSSQTGTPQNVGSDTAVLTGVVDPRGRSTTWWFQYGTSTGYGLATPSRSAGSQAGAQTVSLTLSGLTPSTTYHYRLVARNDAGTTQGADVAFTTQGVTLTVRARQVVFGGRIRLAGVVPTRQAGEPVTVFAQPYGSGSPHSIATVLTGLDGSWTYLAKPQIATAYSVSWRGGASAQVRIGVHPRIALARLPNGRLLVHVTGGRSFAHRLVQLQRRSGTHWSTIKRVRLGVRSRAEFRVVLPKGRSQLRIALSVNQAGAGFLGGVSRVLTVTITS